MTRLLMTSFLAILHCLLLFGALHIEHTIETLQSALSYALQAPYIASVEELAPLSPSGTLERITIFFIANLLASGTLSKLFYSYWIFNLSPDSNELEMHNLGQITRLETISRITSIWCATIAGTLYFAAAHTATEYAYFVLISTAIHLLPKIGTETIFLKEVDRMRESLRLNQLIDISRRELLTSTKVGITHLSGKHLQWNGFEFVEMGREQRLDYLARR